MNLIYLKDGYPPLKEDKDGLISFALKFNLKNKKDKKMLMKLYDFKSEEEFLNKLKSIDVLTYF